MNLENILAYQDVDCKLYALEMQILNSEAQKNIRSLNATKKDCSENILKSVKDIDSHLASADKFKKAYESLNYQIEELLDVLDSFEEPREIDLYEKKLAQQQKELEGIEREISRIARALDAIETSCKETIAKVIKCNQLMKTYKEELEQMKLACMGEVKDVKAQLSQIAKDLPVELLEKYNQIRKNNKMPVFVHFNEKSGACSGCGMDIDYNLKQKLAQQGTIECPNCGRIIYSK